MADLSQLHERVENDFGFHPATAQTKEMHEDVRAAFKQLAHFIIETAPVGREQSLALTALQEAAMWTNAAVAVNLAPLEGVV